MALIESVNVQPHCETKHRSLREVYPQMSEVRAHKITEMGVQHDDLPNFVESQIDRYVHCARSCTWNAGLNLILLGQEVK